LGGNVRTIVVGAGPVGIYCGLNLARRGHQVMVVDRDAPPSGSAQWPRRGVMQFNLPHFFRPIVREVLLGSLPDVWDALVTAGGIPARPDGFPEELTGLQCRRSTFERVTWSMAAREPGMELRTGHVQRLLTRGGRVTGVDVDGVNVEAEVVIVAAGRAGRIGDEYRVPGEGGACGFSYAARMYRAREGTEPPASALPMNALYDGYLAMVFPQDDRTLSALIVRPSSSDRLARLRHEDAFAAAAREIPLLAQWTDAERFDPISSVLAGSGLTNMYRGQTEARAGATGLFFVGDTVCTTNPAAGRGVSLGLRQAAELLRLLHGGSTDYRGVCEEFDLWCTINIRPWYEDHVYWDATLLARLRGEDIDVDGRLPSDVICAAAGQDPRIWRKAGPYLAMQAPPASLGSVEEEARAVLRTGWRPAYEAGPRAQDLADMLDATAVSAAEASDYAGRPS
jgi:2-polyprenyl-6-methoxyphenol hydroxylase-like FAD-dependent oxidoreductase